MPRVQLCCTSLRSWLGIYTILNDSWGSCQPKQQEETSPLSKNVCVWGFGFENYKCGGWVCLQIAALDAPFSGQSHLNINTCDEVHA